MKTQFSNFYAQGKTAIKAGITFAWIIAIPAAALTYGLMIFAAYLSVSFIAILPALTVSQAILIALPFALVKFGFYFCKWQTFSEKRNFLKKHFLRYQKLDALRG